MMIGDRHQGRALWNKEFAAEMDKGGGSWNQPGLMNGVGCAEVKREVIGESCGGGILNI